MSKVETEPLDVVVTGDGPDVVLIHGTGADAASNWGSLIEATADRYRLVAPNLPGAGATPESDVPLDVPALVDRLWATVDTAGVTGPVHVVGHSLGAVLAAAVAARHPQRVRSLFLHAGWATSGPRERVQFDLWARLLTTDTRLLARTLVLTAMSPALLAKIDAAGLDELVAGFETLIERRILGQVDLDARVDIADLLPRIVAPTLVVASEDDQIVPTHHQRALADAIAGARYLSVPGGHALPFEDPTGFAAVIAEHLDRHEAR